MANKYKKKRCSTPLVIREMSKSIKIYCIRLQFSCLLVSIWIQPNCVWGGGRAGGSIDKRIKNKEKDRSWSIYSCGVLCYEKMHSSVMAQLSLGDPLQGLQLQWHIPVTTSSTCSFKLPYPEALRHFFLIFLKLARTYVNYPSKKPLLHLSFEWALCLGEAGTHIAISHGNSPPHQVFAEQQQDISSHCSIIPWTSVLFILRKIVLAKQNPSLS